MLNLLMKVCVLKWDHKGFRYYVISKAGFGSECPLESARHAFVKYTVLYMMK